MLSVHRAAQSSVLGIRTAVGPVPERHLSRCCQTPTGGTLWLLWDTHMLDSVAGLSVLRPSHPSGGAFAPQSKVPAVPGASQCLPVISFMTMPSASIAMAAATASPRRMISSLVAMVVAGGDVVGMASWGSTRYVGPSILVMPVSMTLLCASTPAARKTGHRH